MHFGRSSAFNFVSPDFYPNSYTEDTDEIHGNLLILFCLIFIKPINLSAQEVTGKIEGRIVDKNGLVIPGAVINLSSPSLQGTRASQSDEKGFFRIILLPPGFYTLEYHSHLL